MAAKKKTARGLFIVFEGIDGAGTTTQAERTVEWLASRGELVHLTREPSDGPIGTLIRQALAGRLQSRRLAGAPIPLDPATIALMFAADRLDHLQNGVLPFVEAGYHVVSDRYVMSSLAYQSVEVDLRFVRQINEKAIAPDITFLLEVAPEVAMDRIASSRPDRDSFETLPFQRTVAENYERLAREHRQGRLVVLPGDQRPGTLASKVRTELEPLL